VRLASASGTYERDVIVTDGTTHAARTQEHWRRVALIVARMTGKRVGLDTATRMLERGDEWDYRPLGRLGGLTFSTLYVIYIVAENQPDLRRKVQPIDIGLTEY
jgi:hypothetical protein